MRCFVLVPFVVTLALGGCGNERTMRMAGGPRGPEGGVLVFDGSMIPQPDAAAPDSGVSDGAPDVMVLDSSVEADTGTTAPQRFVPDIPLSYDGTLTDPGVEIVGFTLTDATLYPTFLVAVRNVSASYRLCAVDLTTRFDDASGTQIGVSMGLVEGHPHRGSSGTGGLVNCISPGQTGLQSALLDLASGYDITDIARGRWTVGAINLVDAVPTTDLQVTSVVDVPTGSTGTSSRFTGVLANRTGNALRNPSVTVFGVNEVGRPLMEGRDVEITTIAIGGNWSFETTSFPTEPYAEVVAFPDGLEL